VPSNITDIIGKAAQETGIYLSIGVTEKDGHYSRPDAFKLSVQE